MVNPNNSGIGGAGLNRLKMKGSEEVASFWDRNGTPQNIFWFGKAWAAHRGRDAELPYDNHFLHALCAPRCLLLTDAYEDFSANPAGTYAAAMATRPVFELLGRAERIGWAYREGGHNHAAEDYKALLDFMDVVSSHLGCCAYYCPRCLPVPLVISRFANSCCCGQRFLILAVVRNSMYIIES